MGGSLSGMEVHGRWKVRLGGTGARRVGLPMTLVVVVQGAVRVGGCGGPCCPGGGVGRGAPGWISRVGASGGGAGDAGGSRTAPCPVAAEIPWEGGGESPRRAAEHSSGSCTGLAESVGQL
jgi:hypothetical protein